MCENLCESLDKGGIDLLSLQAERRLEKPKNKFMKENKEVKISYVAAHFTTIISVTLVLVLVGIIAMVWIGAGNETRRLRERMELSVVMADTVSDAYTRQLADEISKKPYALKVTFVGKDEALKNWTRDTGENLEELFGVNPLSPEINFTLKADYSSVENIAAITGSLEKVSGVEAVSKPETEMVEQINSSLSRLTALLGAIAIVMLVISFVLINNTVHLTIYSRRFTIHTMQLVGATNSYIRRPVVMNNMLCGFVSGVIASGVIAAGLAFAPAAGFSSLNDSLGWMEYAVVAGGIILVGMIICSMAAWMASAKYLGKNYDELFK